MNLPFSSLDPSRGESSGSNHVFPLLYSFLIVPNSGGKFDSDLAVKWDYDPENYSWTIHIKENAFFHNGKPVTSKDVKFSYEHVLKTLHPSIFTKIDKITLLSDTSIKIDLLQNDPDFLKKIWDVEIIPFNWTDNSSKSYHPVGSGPFKFKHRNGDKEVVLEAYDRHYGGCPSLDRVVFYYQPDKEKSWSRLLANKTDIAQEITPHNFEVIKQQYKDRFYFHQYILTFYTILFYNNLDPLFSDARVRTALTYSIDREYIVKHILNGYGEVANGPMGVNSPYHNPEIRPTPFNPSKSLELLQEKGWVYDENCHFLKKDDKFFEFTILVIKESQIEKDVARYICLALNEIGIKATIELLPFDEFKKRFLTNKTFQAVLSEFPGVNRSPEVLKRMWSSEFPGRSDSVLFNHPEINRLINNALKEKNLLKQQKLFYEIEDKIIAIQPGTWFFQKSAINVMSKRFFLNSSHPFTIDHPGTSRLKFISIHDE